MSALLRGHIARRLDLCSTDEARVIDRVLSRLERRRLRKGSLDLAKRPDIFAELDEGLIDAVIACSILAIRAEDQRHADEQAEVARWERMDRRTPAPIDDAVPEPIGDAATNRSSKR